MLLIEVNNEQGIPNTQLIKDTERWVKSNMAEGIQYTIVVNTNLNVPMRITTIKDMGEGEE
jgi:hypothetical protein